MTSTGYEKKGTVEVHDERVQDERIERFMKTIYSAIMNLPQRHWRMPYWTTFIT